MQEDKAWDRITDAIDARYGIIEHGRASRPVADAIQLTEQVAFIVFERGGARYKLERVAGPAIIDRKTIGARRAGATVRYENVYDPSETSFRTIVFRQEGTDWLPVDLDELGL
jgi:hypothetical protein